LWIYTKLGGNPGAGDPTSMGGAVLFILDSSKIKTIHTLYRNLTQQLINK
jgi:hypothetical protein